MSADLTNTELARGALEKVCSGQSLDKKESYYSPTFVDHVNGQRLEGYAGIEKSVAAYRSYLRDLKLEVLDQVVEGDKVACRFKVSGVVLGRKVGCEGITISRIENGLIAEDWSITDTRTLLKQIGALRLFLLSLRIGRQSQ